MRIDDVREAVRSLEARMEQRFALVDQRLDRMEGTMARQFHWLVGLGVTMLVAIVGGLAGVIAAILKH
jgi:hypothetical protein